MKRPAANGFSALAAIIGAHAGLHQRLGLLGALSTLGGITEAVALTTLVALVSAMASAPPHLSRVDLPLVGGQVAFTALELAAVCALAIVARAASQLATTLVASRLVTDFSTGKWLDLTHAFLAASWELQARERASEIFKTLSVNLMYAIRAVRSFGAAFSASCNLLVLLAAAFFLDPPAAAGIIAVIGLLFLASRPLAAWAQREATSKSSAEASFYGHVNDHVRMAREIRLFGATQAAARTLSRLAGVIKGNVRRAAIAHELVSLLYQNGGALIVVGGLALLFLSGPGELGAMATVALLLVRCLGFGEALHSVYHQTIEATPYLQEVAELEKRYADARLNTAGAPVPKIETLAFDRICFAYDGAREVLEDVSFSVEAGQTIGVIGPSGSGKSTMVQLLLRLRRPRSGRVLANAESVDRFDLSDWHRTVSFVPQEAELFDGSVADNIVFFREGVDQAAVERAAELAGIHDEIVALPDGYGSRVGERGGSLSVGQRQRICIARALAGSPQVVVFDEPTSALDVHSEARIQKSLEMLRGETTLIIIAHRLSTLGICDRIVVLRQGRVAAFAAPAELAAQNAYYREALALSGMA